jgi:hypothetical protein
VPRRDVDQSQVLESFVDLLRRSLGLDDRRCIITLDPPGRMAFIPAADWWLTVTPGEGVFVDGEQAFPNVTEEFSLSVCIYTRIRLDHVGEDKVLILDGLRGLYPLKQRILAAMIGQDPTLTWRDEAGAYTFARAMLRVVHASAPNVAVLPTDARLTIGWMSLTFVLPFDWSSDVP